MEAVGQTQNQRGAISPEIPLRSGRMQEFQAGSSDLDGSILAVHGPDPVSRREKKPLGPGKIHLPIAVDPDPVHLKVLQEKKKTLKMIGVVMGTDLLILVYYLCF